MPKRRKMPVTWHRAHGGTETSLEFAARISVAFPTSFASYPSQKMSQYWHAASSISKCLIHLFAYDNSSLPSNPNQPRDREWWQQWATANDPHLHGAYWLAKGTGNVQMPVMTQRVRALKQRIIIDEHISKASYTLGEGVSRKCFGKKLCLSRSLSHA